MEFLHQIITDQAKLLPDRPAVLWRNENVSFAELQKNIESARKAILINSNYGDRIAILGSNNLFYVELLYGIPSFGRICVPLNIRLSTKALINQVKELDVRIIIGDSKIIDELRPLLRPECLAVNFSSYRKWCSSFSKEVTTEKPILNTEDIAWLLFTSGTTGKPKAACITHKSLIAGLASTNQGRPVLNNDCYLYPFPLFHIASHNVLHQHHKGAAVALIPSFDAEEVLLLCEKQKVTSMSLAPTMMTLILDSPNYDRKKLESVRLIDYGASAISPPLLKRVLDETDCDLSQGYGMTELSGSIAFLGPEQHRLAHTNLPELLQSVGQLVEGVECQLVDRHGKEVAKGESGEIIVRGAQVISKYWNNPEATAETFKEGWLYTGDIGRFDSHGNLSVIDRKKDIIISGGENIASREVEAVISLLDNVKQVAVVGIADQKWGECVCAMVERVNEQLVEPSKAKVISQCRGQLASFKSPKRILFDSLPVNANGKIDKQKVKRRFNEEISKHLRIT